MKDLGEIARKLDEAARAGRAIPQLSEDGIDLTVSEAYAVQALSVTCRLDRGEQIVGIKMGFTSRAKMQQMGVSDLIWGRLTDAMIVSDGSTLDISHFVHPRIEPEVAFRLARPLAGRVTLAEAVSAVEVIAPALEIIDSRYQNFRFSLCDVIADNSSSSGFVIGAWQSCPADISNLGISLECNGAVMETGSSAAILGNPYRSLVEAARLAAEAGIVLQPGWIVLAGAATSAIPLQSGAHFRVEVQHLGTAELHTAGGRP